MTTQQLPVEAISVGYRELDLLVLDCLRIQAWDRVLFVQCGDGWIVEEAWRRAQRAYVCGLDMSAVQIEQAKRLREVPGRLDFRTWDGRQLPVAEGWFGRVVLNCTGTQALDLAALLAEVRRVLRSPGELYLIVPASADAGLRRVVAGTAWPDVREVARSGPLEAVLVRAVDQKIV